MIKQYIKARNEIVEATNGHWAGKSQEEAKNWKDEGYMFISTFGEIPNDTGLSQLLFRLLKKADVKRVTFHALRHTFATRAIESGFDVKSLSEILGHKDASITLNIYAHALEEQKRCNMDKLENLCTGQSETSGGDS